MSDSYSNRLDQFCSTPFGEKKIRCLCQVSVVRCWRMSLNLISKYLFLEQKAQSLEEVLTFLTKAGGSIHIFSESTHIEALIKPCKMMKIKKKSYLYNPNAYWMTMPTWVWGMGTLSFNVYWLTWLKVCHAGPFKIPVLSLCCFLLESSIFYPLAFWHLTSLQPG